MDELREILENEIEETLIKMTLSGSRSKDGPSKIRIRPIQGKGGIMFQAASLRGKQEFHKNYERQDLVEQVLQWMNGDFKQLQMETTLEEVHVLSSKKGRMSVKRKKRPEPAARADLSHNRRKKYILEEGKPVPFLIDLGVMTKEGRVVKSRYDKFRQINRFLEFIEDVLPSVERGREWTILDFGCGKSYLTFAMYYYLKVLQGLDIRIVGLDLKEEVISRCTKLAEAYGYDKLSFLTGDIASYEGLEQVDMVVTLHACDTATDYALEKAVKWKARVILSVPCCQHELNRQMDCPTLQPLLKYGLIKERIAALATDALRAGMLEQKGYRVQILEFIDMEHTPKNILIRAIYTGKSVQDEKLTRCMEFLGVEPLLGKLLPS